MSLIQGQLLSKSFGMQVLFQELSISIFPKDRIGLIGPNGAGKTTLIKILANLEQADAGQVIYKKKIKIAYIPQICDFDDIPLLDVLLQIDVDDLSEHEKLIQAKTVLSKLSFTNIHQSAEQLSGGQKKRLSIASALFKDPDILMLDEPTNHLDLESILWLETFLLKEIRTFIVVSHDRSFLQNVTNKTIEINPLYPSGLFAIDGSFQFFLEKKTSFIDGQIEQEKSMMSKVRKESHWLKQTPKARSTKSRSRIDQAKNLFEEHAAVKSRNKQQKADIAFEASERQTRKLLICHNLQKTMGATSLFNNLDLTITSKMRLGLMGPNGSGKTTLMRLLADELQPDQGTIKRADDLKFVYFDQHRAKLPTNITLKEALSPSGDYVVFQKKHIHINAWCKRFLFPPEYLKMTIDKLSGGENARISIARFMQQEADILLLDEPTNDLDIPTLETLEQNLKEFPGAVILISHDRSMLRNVCNLFLALGDNSGLYADYTKWEASKKVQTQPRIEKKKGGFREERKEMGRIEKSIEKKEAEIKQLEALASNNNLQELQDLHEKITSLKQDIEALFDRWAILEEKINS